MNRFCGNCFNDSLNDQQICSICGFDSKSNWDKAPHGLPAGTILNGRYIIGRVLGQGGFGITYTARDHQTGQLVAVKEFFPDSMATRTERTTVTPFSGDRGESFVYGKECFLREAQTMAEFIGNPNIVRVFSYFEENGTAYFVMEYVDGQSLQDYLKARGGSISLEEALEILYPVMDALSAVHEKGIIHRDIAPDNIYISKTGEVKLLDFGAARYSLGNVSRSLDVILKHGFAPKEQYKRRGRQGPYTDVYATAATLYYAITGSRPDDALERQDEDDMPLPSTLGAKISPSQEDVLLKAMEVDAVNRYQTMPEFRDALKKAALIISEEEHKQSEELLRRQEEERRRLEEFQKNVHDSAQPAQDDCPRDQAIKNAPKAEAEPKMHLNRLIPFFIGIFILLACIAFLPRSTHNEDKLSVVSTTASSEAAANTEAVTAVAPSTETKAVYTIADVPFGVHTIDYPSIDSSKYGFFWGQYRYKAEDVRTITFQGDFQGVPKYTVDVSENKDGSILSWMDQDGNLTVATNGTIAANPDSSYMFADFKYIKKIDFGNCFDTSNVSNMHCMFFNCFQLNNLDLTSFDTSNVTDMSGMFGCCSSLSELNLSSFDVSNVCDMSMMFLSCPADPPSWYNAN